MQTTPHEQLAVWVKSHGNTITQHSDAWDTARKYSVGGSSIATIMGENPYETIYSFISKKLGVTEFRGDIKTQWGCVFEKIIRDYVSTDRCCEISCEDYFISNGNLSYSPDGLAVIDDEVTLLEFKCPYSRIPGPSPPKYYTPQVKMGLEMIPVATKGIFVEGVFRKCSWMELCEDTYQVFPDQKPVASPRLYALGVLGFVICRESAMGLRRFKEGFLYHYGEYSRPGSVHDLSELDLDLFTQMFTLVRQGAIRVIYPDYNTTLEAQVSTIMATTDTVLGILPWKLVQVKYSVITKTPGYLDPWKEKINALVECLEACATEPAARHHGILNSFYSLYAKENYDTIPDSVFAV